jgi:hypothetical protein
MDEGATAAHDSTNPWPSQTGCYVGHFSNTFMSLKWGEGIFIISDINNSSRVWRLDTLNIHHSLHPAFCSWLHFPVSSGKQEHRPGLVLP